MIRPIAAAVLCVAALSTAADAQTLDDAVVSQYALYKKSNIAAKECLSELDRMQVERNGRYDALVHAKAQNPDAPTIRELSDVLAQIRDEDAALGQKREACAPLLDELVAAATELRRDCAAYSVPANTVSANTGSEPAPGTDLATTICRGPAKAADAGKPAN
jgi:hypothetical protein